MIAVLSWKDGRVTEKNIDGAYAVLFIAVYHHPDLKVITGSNENVPSEPLEPLYSTVEFWLTEVIGNKAYYKEVRNVGT